MIFFFAIIVRVSPTTERKVMACSRFDTPPSCTVDNASFLVAVNALTLCLFARIDSQLRADFSWEMLPLVTFQDFVPP